SSYYSSIRALDYDPGFGNVFIVTEAGKLFCYDEKKRSYSEIPTFPRSSVAAPWNYRKDPDALWFMACPGGLLEINRRTKEAVVIAHQSAQPASLLPGGVNS